MGRYTSARILIVDDNPSAARSLQLVLDTEGYAADIATSADEAVAMAAGAHYDAALIDISLPERSGLDVLADLKTRFPELVAIMVTGHASAQNSIDALNRGANGYVQKPVDVQQLLGLLRGALERQRLQADNRRMLRRLSLLYALAAQVGSGLEAETTLQETVSLVVSLLDLPTGAIWWSNGPKGEPVLAAALGLTADMIAALTEEVRNLRLHGDASVRAQSGGWFDVEAPFSESEPPWRGKLIPLRVPESTVGYMAIGGPGWREDRAEDAEVLSAVSWQIGIAMENMRLYGDLKTALEQLRAAQAQIVQAEKLSALGRVVSGVAHELNNPLMVILGYADIIREDQANPETAEMADRIYSQAERAGNIVRSLLAFARGHRPVLQPTNLHDVLEATLESTKHSSNGRVHISVELPEDLPPVAGDPNSLQQVFTNLITNAQQAIGQGEGRITITGAYSEEDVTVQVQDTGPGIPEEMLPRIFDPFFTTKGLNEGTGLGLSVCHGIISDHGGAITAANLETGGAVFTIRLPRHLDSAEPRIERPEAQQNAPWLASVGGE